MQINEIEQKIINNKYLENNFKKELYKGTKFINKELEDKIELSQYIHKNIERIKLDENENELNKIYHKIISKKFIFKSIVEYEFNNYEPEIKLTNLSEIIKLALHNISFFQNIIGGYDLEDNEWIFSDETEIKRFNLKDNQKLIYNSLSQNNKNEENNLFIKKYVKYIKRHIDSESRINIYHKLINDDKNEICWVVIIFEKLVDYLD